MTNNRVTFTNSMLLLTFAIPAVAQTGDRDVRNAAHAIAAVRAATVSIEMMSGSRQSSSGSGFIVQQTGTVVTAAHVIEHSTDGRVILSSGQSFPIDGVLHYDADLDLAIVKIRAAKLPVVALGGADSVPIGSRLFAVGSPLGLTQTVSDGLLSGVREVGRATLFQISAPVSPGSSGGPVFLENG